MVWMLEGATIEATPLRIALLTGAWLAVVNAWRSDESADLAGSMAALDRALDRIGGFDGVFARAMPEQAPGLPSPT